LSCQLNYVSHVLFGSTFFGYNIGDQIAHLPLSIVVTLREWIIPIADRHEVRDLGAPARRTKNLTSFEPAHDFDLDLT
jgi:hypothetical protein